MALASLVGLSLAQVNFPEVEPNSSKLTATMVGPMSAGDTISGVSTGLGTVAGDTSQATADYFRVRTPMLPYGIYRHTLTITSATAGHTGTIRGLNQTGVVGIGGTAGAVDVTVQNSSSTTTPPRFNAWYGFGRQEEIYYRVTGTSATSAAYAAVLTTTGVTPIYVNTPFNPGLITVTTQGQGHTTDTDLWLYDQNFNAISTAGNDDPVPGAGGPSTLVRRLSQGDYYVALSTWNLANDQVAAADDNHVAEPLLDFPRVVANATVSNATIPLNLSISDGTTTTPVVVARASPFEIVWIRFTVSSTDTVLAGSDIFVSLPGASVHGFASAPIPAGFFGPGSDPFSGSVVLNGSPLQGTGLPAGTDTIVKRTSDAYLVGCPSSATVPIEIVALSLVSVSPITVTFNGGTSSSSYNVRFQLSSVTSQPTGYMTIQRTRQSGGTFDSQLFVVPNAVFTKVSGANGQSLLTLDPVPYVHLTAALEPWSYDDFYYGVPHTPGGLVDHDGNAGTAPVPFAATSNFIPGLSRPGGSCGSDGGPPAIAVVDHADMNITLHPSYPPLQPFQPFIQPCEPFCPGGYCVPFCTGDTVGSSCWSCGNNGASGRGCANSSYPAGTLLSCSGTPSIAHDTLVLRTTDMTGPGLFFQANGLSAPLSFGDGMLCATSGIIRLGIVFPSAGEAFIPGPFAPSLVHIAGAPVSAGDMKHYQCWYRDLGTFCTSSNFNTSNGVSLTWQP